ncbi:MAG TPA: ABC transporter substrate-binding protein [Methylomirabilota bacterium]|nr:ABC transporter substrate-binding protein [Methylomirabilota bacterium]
MAQRSRPVRIGAISESWGPTPALVGIKDGLLELGYREHDDFVIGVRFTRGDFGAVPTVTRDFIQQGLDVLVLGSTSTLAAALKIAPTVPVIFVASLDPVALGVVRSYAKPGGNVTGVTTEDVELAPKRLELLRALAPGVKRVLFAYDSGNAASAVEAKAYREAGRVLGVELVERPVRTQDDAKLVFANLSRGDVQAILAPFAVTLNIPGFILDNTARLRVPTMFNDRFYVERGGLASYGASAYESGRQAARILDKVIRGGRPGDIPIEANNRVEFVVNAKVARAMSLTVPRDLLPRIDSLLE